jgi:hypothetical protein
MNTSRLYPDLAGYERYSRIAELWSSCWTGHGDVYTYALMMFEYMRDNDEHISDKLMQYVESEYDEAFEYSMDRYGRSPADYYTGNSPYLFAQ